MARASPTATLSWCAAVTATATGRRAVRAGRGGVGGRETEDLCERTVLGALPAAFQVQADHGQEHLCAGQIFNRPCAWCLAPRGAWSCALISQRPLVLPVPHSLITHGPTRPASHPRICYRLPSLKSTACSRYQHEAKSLSSPTDGECTVYWGALDATPYTDARLQDGLQLSSSSNAGRAPAVTAFGKSTDGKVISCVRKMGMPTRRALRNSCLVAE